jgi:hypothetical protein
MTALTLVEAAKLNRGEVVRSAVIEMFAQESDILRVLPFQNIAGNAYSYSREAVLPGIAFRGVNESYTASTGVVNPLTEALTICGGDLDVDRFIVTTQGAGVRSTHERLKVKALAAEWARVFIKGDSETEPREFDGLQKRLTGAQLIDAGSASGGDALSLAKLDEAIDAVDGATHLFMSKAMRRRMTAAARSTSVGGYITYDVDAFGRRVTMYNDLPILVPYSDNGGTEMLAFDEACPGGGSSVGTSIYVLGLGTGKLSGIQNGTMDVRDLGELDTAPVFRTRVEWYASIALEHGRAAARLRGIKDAAVVA